MTLLRLLLQTEDYETITPCIEKKRAHPDLEIRKIDSQLIYRGIKPHPLIDQKDSKGRDQYGVFANRKIPKGSALGEFTGEVTLLSLAEAKRQNKIAYNYIIPLNNQNLWCIDSDTIANEMMYVNDYHGIQDAPNAHLTRMVNRGFAYFGYAALRDIEADEEIVVDYENRRKAQC